MRFERAANVLLGSGKLVFRQSIMATNACHSVTAASSGLLRVRRTSAPASALVDGLRTPLITGKYAHSIGNAGVWKADHRIYTDVVLFIGGKSI